MRNSKSALVAVPLAMIMALTGCGKESENTDFSDLASLTKLEDIVDGISKLTYLDEYLEDNGYQSLISDYIGFRDSGDFQSANMALYKLSKLVFDGSIIDTLYREDKEFASRLGKDFEIDDVKITTGIHKDTCNYFLLVTIDGDEKYSEFTSGGEFAVAYNVNGIVCDMMGMLNSFSEGTYRDAEQLTQAFNFIKEFMMYSGCYSEETMSAMSGLSLGGVGPDDAPVIGMIDFELDYKKVNKIK